MQKKRQGSTFKRKAAKLFRHPGAFLRDSALGQIFDDREVFSELKQPVFAWGFATWKRDLVSRYFPQYEFHFVPLSRSPGSWPRLHRKARNPVFIVWGYQEPTELADYAREHDIPLYRMEDGFVRSVGLGAAHTPPRSLVLDETGRLYFDARGASRLEELCQTYDFRGDPTLMQEAEECLRLIVEGGISKYNNAPGALSLAHAEANKKRILVVGQVEDDASLLYGRAEHLTNLDAARVAREENPDADIIFKPHPDVLHGYAANRPTGSADGIEAFARVMTENVSLGSVLSEVDHVYTLTSLAGFEAVLRGLTVTVLGYPFYAGWGLTDDRQKEPRRSRTLTSIELFAATYLLYPKYFDPETGEGSDLRGTMLAVLKERDEMALATATA